jgi:hypothetical protein
MRNFTTPPITITATVIGGVLTAIFDPVAYDRKINSLVVSCDSVGPVNVFRGIPVGSGLIATNSIGGRNTYMPVNRDVIPAGSPMYIVWPSASAGVATATAVFEGEMQL